MPRPRLAVVKLASCDGCQLSLLDCEDELIAVAGAVEIVNFPEASRAVQPGEYTLSLGGSQPMDARGDAVGAHFTIHGSEGLPR